MTVLRGMGIVVSIVFCAGSCMLYRGPRGVEDALERQLGVEMERAAGIKLGWTSTHFVMSLARNADEDPALDFDLDGIGVAAYTIPAGAGKIRLDPRALGLAGWDTAIRAHDEDGDVLLVTRARGGRVRELVFIAIDGDEAVLGRLEGDLSELVEKMVSDTWRDGTRAARRALPTAD